MEYRCIAFTKNGRCKRQGRWLCHQHKWSFPIQIVVAMGFIAGVLSNLWNMRDAFYSRDEPLYINLSAIKSDGKWLSVHPNHATIWIEQHNPNVDAVEIQITGGSVQFLLNGIKIGNVGKSFLPPQAPIILGPMQKQIATGYILFTPIPKEISFIDALRDGNGTIFIDTSVRYRKINSESWRTMEIKYNLSIKGWNLLSRNLVGNE